MYRGLAQTATAAAPVLSSSSSMSPLLLLGGGILAALIFLPGWWKLAVPAGLVGLLVAGNWKQCSQIAGEGQSYLLDHTTGLPVPGSTIGSPLAGPLGVSMTMGCPAGHVCSPVSGPATATPQWSCLSQLFVGGL
jgi:hypothetical protein